LAAHSESGNNGKMKHEPTDAFGLGFPTFPFSFIIIIWRERSFHGWTYNGGFVSC